MKLFDKFFQGKDYLSQIEDMHKELSSKKDTYDFSRFKQIMKRLTALEKELLAKSENPDNIKQIAGLIIEYSEKLGKELKASSHSVESALAVNKILDKIDKLLESEIKINERNKRDVFGLREKLVSIIEQRKIDPKDLKKIHEAIDLLFEKQTDTLRNDGRIYAVHPLEVTINLIETLKYNEPDLIIAALLHDILEDNPEVGEEHIRERFGERVLAVMKGLTYVKKSKDKAEETLAYQKHVIKEAENEDVLLVKVHDMETNALSLAKLKDPKRRKYLANKYLPIVIFFSEKLEQLSKKYWNLNRKYAEGLLAKAHKYKAAIPQIRSFAEF